jgi:hypothetical protein
MTRHLPAYATDEFREAVAAKCADHAGIGPATLLLYDVTVRHEALGVRVGVKDPHRGLPP